MTGFIYFLRCGDFIKIGFSKQPDLRVASIATANPLPVVLAAVYPGSKADEFNLHVMFARHRSRGEWFARHPDIDAAIATGLPQLKPPFVRSDNLTTSAHPPGSWKSDLQIALRAYGSAARLADALGWSRTYLYQITKWGHAPSKRRVPDLARIVASLSSAQAAA